MNECVNLENVGRVEELLAMTEQMQDELGKFYFKFIFIHEISCPLYNDHGITKGEETIAFFHCFLIGRHNMLFSCQG